MACESSTQVIMGSKGVVLDGIRDALEGLWARISTKNALLTVGTLDQFDMY